MASRDHPVAGIAFLLVGLGLIAAGAWSGISAGQEERNKAEQMEREQIVERIQQAVAFGERGNLEAAVHVLSKVVEEHPDDTDALYNLAVALSHLKEYRRADQILQRVIELNPDDYDAVAERAGLLQDQGSSDKALEILETIPAGEARMKIRLGQDPLWANLSNDPRMIALKKKHGVEDTTGTSTRAPTTAP